MRAVRFSLSAVVFVAACGVRTPPPLDVTALVRAHGEVGARRELTARVLGDPRDVQARLALAALAERAGRPSEAVEQLEAVLRLGGPVGTRWRDEDRARLGRLLLARGRARLARHAATALADLERAATFGARATPRELARARIAVAIVELRHVDEKERARGRAILASFAGAGAGGRAGTGAARGDTGAARGDTGAARSGTDAALSGTGATRGGTDAAPGDTGAARSGTDAARSGTDAARSGTDPARGGTGAARGDPGVARSGTDTPRSGTDAVRSGTDAAGSGTHAVRTRLAIVAVWRGARPEATPAERAAFGRWLWQIGARREAYLQLAAWHAATKPPRDPELQGAWLRALAWWSPVWLGEVKPPPATELVGPERCWFPGTDCEPPAIEPPAIAGPPARPIAAPAAPRRVVAAVRYAAARLDFADSLDTNALLDFADIFDANGRVDSADVFRANGRVDSADVFGANGRVDSADIFDANGRVDSADPTGGPARRDTAAIAGRPARRDSADPKAGPARRDPDATAGGPARGDSADAAGGPARRDSADPAGGPARRDSADPKGGPARRDPDDPAGGPARGDSADAAGGPARRDSADAAGGPARRDSADPTGGPARRDIDAAPARDRSAEPTGAGSAQRHDPDGNGDTAGTRIDAGALAAIAQAFARDPAIAERLGRDFVARATDAALAHAMLGALLDALGDPARARAAWQAAVDASPEPLFMRGLAESAARTGDGAAALVFATHASAAWGDPAVVWTSVARELVAARQLVDAMSAARTAIDLAGPEVLPRALEVASDASRALGRTQQADALLAERARLPVRASANETVARDALVAHREQPTAATTAQLWVASRGAPRDVDVRAALLEALDVEDPRRATIVDELVVLAGDRDPARAYAAVVALRR